MAATIGQLRGLHSNGWADHVRYISAVSGGSWAAVPYTYYQGEIDALLGRPTVRPQDLDPDSLVRAPAGRLLGRVAAAGLLQAALPEIVELSSRETARQDVVTLQDVLVRWARGLDAVSWLTPLEPRRLDKTYARMLGRVFLAEHAGDPAIVPRATIAPYTWHLRAAVRIATETGCPASAFLQTPAERPFLIVGAALIMNRNAFTHPQLVPVEFTPLYTGIRQHFGSLGGTYVVPWAYDRVFATWGGQGRIRVGPGPFRDPFTLADVMAASGAAPVLPLLRVDLPERVGRILSRATAMFPAFRAVTVRADGASVTTTARTLHGDGGFMDNLALMPLLARQVKNILVFVNADREWGTNTTLESYFARLGTADESGDKRMNRVFGHQRYLELLANLNAAKAAGEAAVHCGTEWTVKENEIYNIRSYHGLNICWVYNHAADQWRKALPKTVQDWLGGPPAAVGRGTERHRVGVGRRRFRWARGPAAAGKAEAAELEDFPYYATFFENAPRMMKLNTLQANLLAELAAWSITETSVKAKVEAAFGGIPSGGAGAR